MTREQAIAQLEELQIVEANLAAQEGDDPACVHNRYNVEALDLALAALRQIAPSPAPHVGMGWQPIASAPKDGTWCVFTSTWNRYARWCARFEDGQWLDINEAENRIGHFESFTHWQPLPSPPTEGT